jgi:Protein of unknown function (DUF3352)
MSSGRNRPCRKPIRNVLCTDEAIPSAACASACALALAAVTTTLRPPARLALAAVAAIALPLAGCGSGGNGGSGAGANDPAKAIPASAPFYLEATVHPTGKDKADLEAAGRKILRTNDPAAKLRALIDQSGRKQGKTYEKDIQPWLGDKAAVAITGFAAGQPEFAVVVDSTDDGKAADEVNSDSTYKEKRSFEGTDYRFNAKDGTAAGVLKHYLVIASEPAFKQVVHLLDKGGDSLATNQDLVDARSATGNRPGFMFVDLQGLLRTVAGSAASNIGSAQLSALNGIFEHFRAFGVGISADAQAVRMTVASIGAKSSGNGPATVLPLDKAPGDAWLAISQKDIGSAIQSVLGSLGGASGSISQLETATGLKVKQDLLSWMGDANLFVEGDSVPALGGALVVQSTDPAKTRVAIAKLKRLLTQFNQHPGGAPAGTSDGFTIPLGSGGKKLLIGLAGNRFVIAVGAQALRDAIHPSSTLSSNANFQSASGLLGSAAKPSFYLNFQTVTRFIALASNGSASFAKAKPYLDAFTALVGGGSGPGKAEIALGLK